MRRCRRTIELRTALAAEEPLDRELSRHVGNCADCTAIAAQYRRFQQGLAVAVDELITDALPPETLWAARLTQVASSKSALPRLVLSGLSAAAVVLFAAVGVAATGAGIVGALTSGSMPAANPEAVQSVFTACYVEEAIISNAQGDAEAITVTVERCLADASGGLDVVDNGIVVGLNRVAADTTACLRTRGWDVEAVLEPGGRFLVPPVLVPAGAQRPEYVRDVEICTEEQR